MERAGAGPGEVVTGAEDIRRLLPPDVLLDCWTEIYV
jgi:hypothetical protein